VPAHHAPYPVRGPRGESRTTIAGPAGALEVARTGGGDATFDKSLSTAPKTGETNWLQDLLKKLGWWQ